MEGGRKKVSPASFQGKDTRKPAFLAMHLPMNQRPGGTEFNSRGPAQPCPR
jgi:hypothetical protein